jgi:hypothetical protein
MRDNQIQWTEERVELLRKMWSEGATVDTIAACLGASRSAVAGKILRLRRAAPPLHLEVPARRRRSKRTGRRKIVAKPCRASLLLLTNQCCRWPHENEKTARFFCKVPGADLERGIPYCPRHMKRAYSTAAAVD